ncbi:hypothetical protein C7R54_23375 [Achromobacter aloeverae]|uniref:DUF1640 domain-containing protein n=1 Tax=Achromobacter aloeverae TaxID=1750518 RepID=A0A4Q1HHX3_9BURK|nr:hypothetical protein C7R54_23375 [Achromobacter aloeverae]
MGTYILRASLGRGHPNTRTRRRSSGDGRGTEVRLAKLEATTEHIQRDLSDLRTEVRGLRTEVRADFRLLFGTILTAAVGLAGLMVKLLGWF